jgi:hypothetical protein
MELSCQSGGELHIYSFSDYPAESARAGGRTDKKKLDYFVVHRDRFGQLWFAVKCVLALFGLDRKAQTQWLEGVANADKTLLKVRC